MRYNSINKYPEQLYMLKDTSGLKRIGMDKFYTKNFISQICVNHMLQFLSFDDNELLIEPSAGDGSFIEPLREVGIKKIFYDIEPEHKDVIKQDFLTLDVSNLQENYRKIHIVGNPPFGRQSSLAIKFIKRSCTFCESISFILPKSFKKESMRKYFPVHFHLIYEMDLPDHSFVIEGQAHDVPCIFQIWEKKDHPRERKVPHSPRGFKFIKKSESPDITLRRVGGTAGTISTEIENKNEQTHYFIKFTNTYTFEENIERLKDLKFTHDNTVGPKSISKPEVTSEFNLYLP